MNERLNKLKTDSTQFWSSRSKKQKGTIIGSVIAVILLAAALTFFLTRTTYVPLFTDLTLEEAAQVKTSLDGLAVDYQIGTGGTSISVPEDQLESLKLQLASEGVPSGAGNGYSTFWNNAGFGMTDNEFNVLQLSAMQTELANLIRQIDGVNDASVMIALPETGVFLNDSSQEPTATVILQTALGHQFSEDQIKTLYNLVAMSVPNLTQENIVITNQYSEDFTLVDVGSSSSIVADQMMIKEKIERDLQRQVQSLLGSLMGAGKVVVSVTTDIDFSKENRQEDLLTPVDEENMQGIIISAQNISETYTGTGAAATGEPEADTTTDNFTTYNEGTFGDGEYERVEEQLNYGVNEIQREISESPYKIRDLGIQVVVEPPTPDDPATLPAGLTEDVEAMLSTIVRTTIDKSSTGTLTEEQVGEKIVVSVQQLHGMSVDTAEEKPFIPWWAYVIGGILLAAIVLLVLYIMRARKKREEEEELALIEEQEELIVEEIQTEDDSEATVRRKQLENMAKEKPEEFAKLLRTWIAED
ncbi:MAG: flagellar basal-body MS-ring/collar protein FliF [Caryophanon sp.]|nr:flagellar basal-body MS-ring/collar protein FliF [Caryophanon sp.]